MRIILKAKNIVLIPQIEKYLEKKLETLKKFLNNFNEGLILAEVELARTTCGQKTGNIFRAEINLSSGGKIFRVESEQADIYSAIDEVRDDLEREIKKFKTKNKTIFLRGSRSLRKKFSITPLARFRNKY